MLRIFLKALITIWPFLRNVIFKDQTFREAFQANRQFTFLFAMTMFVVGTLAVTSLSLSEAKEKLQTAQKEVERLNNENSQLNKSKTVTTKKDNEPIVSCDKFVAYDKSHVIRLLD